LTGLGVAAGTFSEGLTAVAKSPLRYAYPRVVVTMRKDGEVEAEDKGVEGTVDEYHLTEGRVEEVPEHEQDAAEDRSSVVEGEDGGTLAVGERRWTSEAGCRF
jgi:hypothetical protein